MAGLTRAHLDLTDSAAVRAEFRRQQPQLVIHCAALSQSPDCEANPALARKLNVEVTALLAELAAEIPLFFLSTDLVFDGRSGQLRRSRASQSAECLCRNQSRGGANHARQSAAHRHPHRRSMAAPRPPATADSMSKCAGRGKRAELEAVHRRVPFAHSSRGHGARDLGIGGPRQARALSRCRQRAAVAVANRPTPRRALAGVESPNSSPAR